jgi:hypothetical protein
MGEYLHEKSGRRWKNNIAVREKFGTDVAATYLR